MKMKWKMLYAVLCFGLIAGTASNLSTIETDKDTIVYEDPKAVPYELGEVHYQSPKELNQFGVKTVRLHYLNEDGDNANRQFYVWVTGYNGKAHDPTYISDDGTEMSIDITISDEEGSMHPEFANANSLFYIIKYRGTWDGQSVDAEIDFSLYTPDENGMLEFWIISVGGGLTEHYLTREETEADKINSATFIDWNTISVEADAAPSSVSVYAYDAAYLKMSESDQARYASTRRIATFNGLEDSTFQINLTYKANINIQYTIIAFFPSRPTVAQEKIVTFEKLYDNQRFLDFYTYETGELGANYTPSKTTFTVWAPTTALMRLRIYETGTPSTYEGGDDTYRSFDMVYQPKGIWTITILGDLNGKYYTYEVNNSNGTNEVVDPYAKGAGINGLRGYIFNYDDTDPDNWDDIPLVWDQNETYDIKTPTELSIYEIHIRDLTMDDTWVSNKGNERGTFNAFVESGTTYSDGTTTVSTGFDHIVELGVNAIQLLPVFDHDDDEANMNFNWGYNPLNYNVVEGGYSSDPFDASVRIEEYKNLIYSFATSQNHIRVIMDVVYNHVSSANRSNFNVLMPRYYFRHAEDGSYMNGSGCNNEVKTEAPMMRRFIVDSVVWWAQEYKVKGFRFDLMGLIDVETMRGVKEALYAIDPDIVVYGEGWSAGTPGTSDLVANTQNAYSYLYASADSPGYVGGFNDSGRDALRGGNNNGGWAETTNPYPGYGFIAQGTEHIGDKPTKIGDMILGIHNGKGANNNQTINYVSCHDNYTLWDQLNYTLADDSGFNPAPEKEPNPTTVAKASLAAHAAVMYSQGMAFIQGGEELFRTKVLSDADLANSIPYDPVEHPVYSEDKEVVACTADVIMYGKVITHNSYASSDECNSFKWDRKISIEYQGETINMLTYYNQFKEMINGRTVSPRIMFEDNCYTDDKCNVWYQEGTDGYASSVIGVFYYSESTNTNHYLFISNRGGGSIGFGGFDRVLFNSYGGEEGFTFSNYTLTLSPYQFLYVEQDR